MNFRIMSRQCIRENTMVQAPPKLINIDEFMDAVGGLKTILLRAGLHPLDWGFSLTT